MIHHDDSGKTLFLSAFTLIDIQRADNGRISTVVKRDTMIFRGIGWRKNEVQGGAPGGRPIWPECKRRPTPLKTFAIATSTFPTRFLLAEDDEDVGFVIEALILVAFPLAHVRGFAHGRLALDDFARTGADLVVCDHDMAEMDGADLTCALRTLQRALPILMVSGSPKAREPEALAGISTFLDKDLVQGGLVREIKFLLPSER